MKILREVFSTIAMYAVIITYLLIFGLQKILEFIIKHIWLIMWGGGIICMFYFATNKYLMGGVISGVIVAFAIFGEHRRG